MPAPANVIQQTSSTVGAGNLTLTIINGRQTFNTAFGIGGADVFDYFILDRDSVDWERGTGSMVDATTLARDTVLENSLGTTALINFGAGVRDVTNDVPAGDRVLKTGPQAITEFISIAFSDELTPIVAATGVVTFRMPYAFTLTEVRLSLTTAQASGAIFTGDINDSGASILSTKLTVDNTEKTSTTAAIPAVISDANIADDAEVTVDVDQIGDGTATGGKIYLIGHKT